MVTGTSLSPVFPLGSRLNERGVLEIGGCDALELAREFGTPAYVVAEDDLTARARAYVEAARRLREDMHVVFASKAFPCTAVLALFAREGLWCDAASGGELHLALNAGFAPERIVLHGNAKSEAELRMALRHRLGLIVIDNFDEIERLKELIAEGEGGDRGTDGQPVLIRVTPDVRGETHEKISTGQADSKFGFSMAGRSPGCAGSRASRCRGCTRTSARSCSSSTRSSAPAGSWPRWETFPSWTSAAGWACPTWRASRPARRSTSGWGRSRPRWSSIEAACSSSRGAR